MHSSSHRWFVFAVAACSGVAACGVQEHEADQAGGKGPTGPVYKPPPLSGGAGGTGGAGGAGGTPTSAGAGGSAQSGSGTGAEGGTSPAGGRAPTAGTGGTLQGRGGSSSGSPASGGGGQTGNGGSGVTGGTAGTGNGAGAGGSAGTPGSGGSAGSSGVMVNINGTMLPKENVVAFIHLGHSNMAGRASGPNAQHAYYFTDVDLYAWMYHQGTWQPALEPGTAGDDGNVVNGMTLGGPGTALMKQAADRAPNHYFVSLGYGKGSAYCSQFLKGGLLYDSMMLNAIALRGKVTFGAIVIMLGITERHGTSADINGFASCINTLTTQIRTDVGEPNLPMLINNYEQGATGTELSPTGTFAQQIIPQINMIPSVVANSALVDTTGLAMQDDHHFNLDGHKEWTKRVLDTMQQKGWFPWGG